MLTWFALTTGPVIALIIIVCILSWVKTRVEDYYKMKTLDKRLEEANDPHAT